MLLKIEREVCLARYRNFPLSPYDPNTDEEVLFYPKIVDGGWYNLKVRTKRELPAVLNNELTKLVGVCGFESLIFLGDKAIPWITKLSAKRTDYVSITKAVRYFKINKLGNNFTGGVQVEILDLPEFIKNFFCITKSDASFHGFHFSDPAQNLLGFIHYGGEVQFQTLNLVFDSQFSKYIRKTAFKRNSSGNISK